MSSDFVDFGRQGDVELSSIESLPLELELEEINFNVENRLVLAHGEATGHAHAIYDKGVATLYKAKKSPHLYLVVNNDGITLKHEEHAPIKIPAKIFEVVRHRQYTQGQVQMVLD